MSRQAMREGLIRAIYDFDFTPFGMENPEPSSEGSTWVPALADHITDMMGLTVDE